MNKKQMKKFAEELYNCELIHQNPNSSKEKKRLAEERIMAITNQIINEDNGLEILSEIDEWIQIKFKNNNND